MDIIRCNLIRLVITGDKSRYYKAIVELTSCHPTLGKDDGRVAITSLVKTVDFENGIIVTQNNIYYFGAENA